MNQLTRRAPKAGVVLLVCGALLFAAGCQPAPGAAPPKASTLYGPSTTGSASGLTPTSSCPAGTDAGGHAVPGTAQKWSARIAAADPKEWLSAHMCTQEGPKGAAMPKGTFTIYTASGEIYGTAKGSRTDVDDGKGNHFVIDLTVTSGSKVYKNLKGTMSFFGCLPAGGGMSAKLAATAGALPASCVQAPPPPLTSLYGKATQPGSTSIPPVDCPDYENIAGNIVHSVGTKVTVRIAAKDPNEWLSAHMCEQPNPHGSDMPKGTFTIYTATGEVRGTAVGGTAERGSSQLTLTLTVTGGTKAYAGAKGTLQYGVCWPFAGGAPIGALGATVTLPNGTGQVCELG